MDEYAPDTMPTNRARAFAEHERSGEQQRGHRQDTAIQMVLGAG